MKNFRIIGRISFGNWVIIAMLAILAYSIIDNTPTALTCPAPQDYRICHAVSKFTADSIETDNGARHGMMVSDIYPIGDTDGLFLLYSYLENAAPPAAEVNIVDYTGAIYNPPGIGPHALYGMESLSIPLFFQLDGRTFIRVSQHYRGNRYPLIECDLTPYIQLYKSSQNAINLKEKSRQK